MTVFLVITALLFVVDYSDLRSTTDLGDGSSDRSLGDIRGADSSVFTIIHEEHLVESDLVTLFVLARKLFNGNNVAF